MKKIITTILSLAFAFCLSAGLVGCKKEYSENGREYIDGYGNINTVSLKRGDIELYVEDTICESKEETEAIFVQLENDYNTLKSVFDLQTKIKVYVIEDDYVLGDTHGAYIDGKVLCNLDIIYDGTYRTYFTGAYLKTSEPWKYYGASEYVFGEPSNDTETLTSYYLDENNLLTLSLFAAYFNDSFADTETIEIAKTTAKALTKYVIDTHGKQTFMNAGLPDYRQEWLTFIGVDKAFNIPYDISWLDNAVYSQKLLQYPLVIKTENRIYHLDSFSAKRESAAFDTPETVLKHLSVGYSETQGILEYVKSQTYNGEAYQFMQNKFDKTIEYYISDREVGTEANVNESKVYLLDPSEYVHETIHILTLQENIRAGAYLAEGVAEYFSREICNEPSDIDYRMYLSFTEETVSGTLGEFVEEVKSQYNSIGGVFTSFEEFEFHLLEKAIAYITLNKPTYKNEIRFPYATTSIENMRSPAMVYEGNHLTYPEAYLFTSYLIEQYGIEKVLNCCIDYNFNGVFGVDHFDAFEQFYQTILDKQQGE